MLNSHCLFPHGSTENENTFHLTHLLPVLWRSNTHSKIPVYVFQWRVDEGNLSQKLQSLWPINKQPTIYLLFYSSNSVCSVCLPWRQNISPSYLYIIDTDIHMIISSTQKNLKLYPALGSFQELYLWSFPSEEGWHLVKGRPFVTSQCMNILCIYQHVNCT